MHVEVYKFQNEVYSVIKYVKWRGAQNLQLRLWPWRTHDLWDPLVSERE
jgi:hypothetical protein